METESKETLTNFYRRQFDLCVVEEVIVDSARKDTPKRSRNGASATTQGWAELCSFTWSSNTMQMRRL